MGKQLKIMKKSYNENKLTKNYFGLAKRIAPFRIKALGIEKLKKDFFSAVRGITTFGEEDKLNWQLK